MNSISVVIITEGKRLENESKMLVSSIRQFGGRFKDVPIYSYQPRKESIISNEMRAFFEKHSVQCIDINLNVNYAYNTSVNKIMVCAHAEKHLGSDIIIFMDCDTVVWQEPSALYEKEQPDVRVVPVFNKLSYAVVEGDENYHYWESLYNLFEINEKQYIQTIVDNKKALAYYNSGIIVVKRTAGILQKVRENFITALSLNKGLDKAHFIDQMMLAVTIHEMDVQLKILDKGYNYPLCHHGDVKNKQFHVNHLDDVVIGHYTILFKKAKWYKNPLSGKMIEGEKGAWFKKKALEYGVHKPWHKKIFS